MRSVMSAGILLAAFSGLLAAQQQPQWWNLSSVVQHQPSSRKGAAMAINYNTGHVVLFGGTGVSDLNDTWLWTGADWMQQFPALNPPPMNPARMVYDSFNKRNVLVGYSTDRFNPGPQTWFWDGAAWTEFSGSNPVMHPGFSLAYDEPSHDVILFGGDGPSNDTWAFNGTSWEWLGGNNPPGQLGPVTAASASPAFASPPARTNGAMTWDRARQQLVLFSGYDYALGAPFLTDTWVWAGRTAGWQKQLTSTSVASNLAGYQAASYFLGGYLLALGFPDGTKTAAETWKWDGANWSLVDTQGPSAHEGFSISEDPLYGGVLLFGGSTYGTLSNQTWGWGQMPVILNKAPVARISVAASVACTSAAGASVALDGSQSYDPDGQPLAYVWAGPGGAVSGKMASMLFPIGASTVTLTVSDGQLTGSASAGVKVQVGVEGLESPLGALVPEPSPAPVPTVSFQAGRTLPLKLGLSCGTSKLSASEIRPPRLVSVALLGSPVAGSIETVPAAASMDSGGLFRSENANWIYNLSTQDLLPGLYLIVIEMPDGLRYRTTISLR